jgi:RNA 2',3'-cyclic 3'-phosphodiesterase
MRLFFALWPPPDTAQALAAWAREVQQQAGGRATAEETIHLTLAFLGEADPAKAIAAARRVRSARFDLPLDTSQYWKHNKIVWVGPRTMPPSLQQLAAQLHQALTEDAFTLEKRAFAAHITLLRKASLPHSLPDLPPLHWPAHDFVLVRSTPTGTGSRYETLERFQLFPEK